MNKLEVRLLVIVVLLSPVLAFNIGKLEDEGQVYDENQTNTFIPDTSVGPVRLLNTKNVNTYLGEDIMNELVDNGLPHSSVLSLDGKQRFTFYFHYGNSANEFSEFQVRYADSSQQEPRYVNDYTFKTESGIGLGLKSTEVIQLKGEPVSIDSTEELIFHYFISENKNSTFLKHYNMPSYYANYTFKADSLVAFSFGFDYP